MGEIYFVVRVPGQGFVANVYGQLIPVPFNSAMHFLRADEAQSIADTFKNQNENTSANVMRVTVTMEEL